MQTTGRAFAANGDAKKNVTLPIVGERFVTVTEFPKAMIPFIPCSFRFLVLRKFWGPLAIHLIEIAQDAQAENALRAKNPSKLIVRNKKTFETYGNDGSSLSSLLSAQALRSGL